MSKSMADRLIYTNNKCQGCNRCISVCPVLNANYSIQSSVQSENVRQRIEVHSENCIACGACFDACEHNARSFDDDTEKFFVDLNNNESVSVLIAPSFQANYPLEYHAVLGGLKKLGVKHIISVSFGADITTWGYVNYINKYGFHGGISQPCPAVVNYIEHYIPELIDKLMPIHSPLLCTAIYVRKYMHITDKLAFISPCIAKKTEITDPNTYGLVSYNLTFSHFMNYIKSHNITNENAIDEVEYGLGSVYPMPGGLKENIYWFCGEDVFLRQIEGEKRAYKFLNDYRERIKTKKPLPFMVDILNCDKGCLYGTGIENEMSHSEDNFYNLQKIKESCQNNSKCDPYSKKLSPAERLEQLNNKFSELDLNDFIRKYTDKTKNISMKIPNNDELQKIFLKMKKDTWEKQNINCGACGYDNCRSMASAIFNGSNVAKNCIYYMKDEIHEFSMSLEKKNRSIMRKNEELRKAIQEEKASELFIDQMIHAFAKSIDLKDSYTKDHSTRVAYYVKKIAEEIGESEKNIEDIYHIALMHDIGKLVVPKAILNKPGRLTDEEYEIIKAHTSNGYEILKEIDSLPNLAIGARYHHERVDGNGYPSGINAEKIPYIAKIIAVADTFDAMNSTRPYRKRMPMEDIITELKKVSGTQLDPDIVNILIGLIKEGQLDTFDD